MHLLLSPRHFRGLVIVPFLVLMLAFPAKVQTGSASETLSTAGAQAESNSAGGPTSDPATPKNHHWAITPLPDIEAWPDC